MRTKAQMRLQGGDSNGVKQRGHPRHPLLSMQRDGPHGQPVSAGTKVRKEGPQRWKACEGLPPPRGFAWSQERDKTRSPCEEGCDRLEVGKRKTSVGAGRPAEGNDRPPERFVQVGSIVPTSLVAGALPASMSNLLVYNARAKMVV